MPKRCKHCESILLPGTRGEYCCTLCARQHAQQVAAKAGETPECIVCGEPAAGPRAKYCATHRAEMRQITNRIMSSIMER